MRHVFFSFTLVLVTAAILRIGSKEFYPEYMYLFADNFLIGLLIGTSICSFFLIIVSYKYDRAFAKAKDYDKEKSSADFYKERIDQLLNDLEEAQIRGDIVQSVEKMHRKIYLDLCEVSRNRNKYILDMFNSALEQLKSELPSGGDSDLVKKQQAALIAFRQERAALKEFASSIEAGDGTLWDILYEHMTQDRRETADSEQKPKKTFTPSAPTKGPRANKYR